MNAKLDRRYLVPEILDALPSDDVRAVGSRRDLIWINALMLQSRIMAGLLNRHVLTPPKRILELGSGDGAFMLAVARRMRSVWRDVELVMVDQADLLTDGRRADFAISMIPSDTIKHFFITTVDDYAFPFAPFASLVYLK